MAETDLAAAAERQKLARILALFPDEVATAAALAAAQAVAMAILSEPSR